MISAGVRMYGTVHSAYLKSYMDWLSSNDRLILWYGDIAKRFVKDFPLTLVEVCHEIEYLIITHRFGEVNDELIRKHLEQRCVEG